MNQETFLVEEAQASIPLRLGDELIDAAREVVSAHYARDAFDREARLRKTIRALEALVGRP
jgi:hypothetical protein